MTAQRRDPQARTRHTDRRLSHRLWRIVAHGYRDMWLFAVTGFVVWTMLAQSSDTTTFHRQLADSRQYAIGVSCAVESAVAETGRAVIAASGNVGSPRFVHNLEALGYRPVTPAAAAQAADLYVRNIALAVQRQVGGVGHSLVLPNGAINCRKLKQLARVP